MQKNTQKGFTLIELLVVIAIIGILATIVLTSLGSATTKAKDTKVEGQVSSMRAQAQLYSGTAATEALSPCAVTPASLFDTANNGLGSLLGGLTLTGSGCYSNATLPSDGGMWAVAIPLSTGHFACADYTGASVVTTGTTLATAVTAASYTCTP